MGERVHIIKVNMFIANKGELNNVGIKLGLNSATVFHKRSILFFILPITYSS